jgi:hypothetical protein
MNTRFLGTIFVIGTLVVMVGSVLNSVSGVSNSAPSTFDSLAYFIWSLSGICGIAGLIRLNALGPNAVARAFGFLPMIAFAFGVVAEGLRLIGLLSPQSSIYSALISIFWVGILAGMLIVGILTIAAKNWRGWRRFVPLMTIGIAPVALLIGQAVKNISIGGAVSFIGFLLLGLVVATFEPVVSRQEMAAA